MERDEVLEAVRDSAVELLKVDRDKVTEDAAFGDDLDADSLDLTELVMALEDRFGIEVPEDDLEDVRTVGNAVDLVLAKVDAGSSA
jgi:acyl carrier protein